MEFEICRADKAVRHGAEAEGGGEGDPLSSCSAHLMYYRGDKSQVSA
jgi:hypothetical protein